MGPKIHDITTDELCDLISLTVRKTIEDMKHDVPAPNTAQDTQSIEKAGSDDETRKIAPLKDEPFVGMWKDREDMADGAAWVKGLRQRQWGG